MGTFNSTLTTQELLIAADHLTSEGREVVVRAAERAVEAHAGQYRKTGEPYFNHPFEVARILAEVGLDSATLVAALLHDTLEDTFYTAEEMSKEFGPEVVRLVEGVTKLNRIRVRSEQEQQAENIRKMLLAMAEDVRVVFIKLADRLHNMRTIEGLPAAKQLRIARETLDIYAPLAHRLGIGQLKWELEDRAFRVLQPEAYREVASLLQKRRPDREQLVDEMMASLRAELAKVQVPAQIYGRPKHIYSIWQKMNRDGRDFSQIYDLLALRVVVESVRDCYAVLGVVHSQWKPMPMRFKDYIATPKSNGYQSLHTTVMTKRGDPIEIQIRSKDMHEVAELGVAAHWSYKHMVSGGQALPEDTKLDWLRILAEWQKDVQDAEHFVNAVKIDFFEREVFVFSPRGDVFNLPVGSTPVDFAYRIHTEIGHHCVGARVNRRMVPLDYQLNNGDIVEVITSRSSKGPSRDWMSFVKSASARERIRKWFKAQSREENVTKGRDLLERELMRMHRISLASLSEGKLNEVAKLVKYPTVEDMFAAIGYGDLSPHSVVMRHALVPAEAGDELRSIPLVPEVRPVPRILVRGERGVMTRMAACCQPVPGDAVVGYVTRGQGITVHLRECKNITKAQNPERLVPVDWDVESAQVYPVTIRIEAWDRTGLLRDIATIVSECRVNMSNVKVRVGGDAPTALEGSVASNTRVADVYLTVEIDSLPQLSRLMEKLETVPDVNYVGREVG